MEKKHLDLFSHKKEYCDNLMEDVLPCQLCYRAVSPCVQQQPLSHPGSQRQTES